MSRDDSLLYSGLSSASFVSKKASKVKEQQEMAAQKRQADKSELKPVAQPILEALDSERDKTMQQLLAMVAPGTPDEDVKSLLISLNLYKQSLDKLKTRLSIILKDQI